jgi:hypothetical protein
MTPLEVVVWTCVAVFAATATITVLALIGRVTLGGGDGTKHHFYLKKLFLLLVVEVVGVSVAAYAESMNSDDRQVVEDLESGAEEEPKEPIAPDESSPENSAAEAVTPQLIPQNEPGPQGAVSPTKILQQRVYASSDGPQTAEKIVKIPSGWQYVGHKDRRSTRNGDASYHVDRIESNGRVTAVRISARAAGRAFLGRRNWIGAELTVTITKVE